MAQRKKTTNKKILMKCYRLDLGLLSVLTNSQ